MSFNSKNEGIYSFKHASEFPEESARLDAVHEAITAHFGGRLSLVPLGDSPSKTILEMGAGSGIWAIQAGKTYPEAEVLAVDIVKTPLRKLPVSNVRFHLADLTQPFSFQPKTFDLVHARFTFMHLPNFEDVLKRSIELVNPGGWLLLEDPDNNLHDNPELGPALEKWLYLWMDILKTKGVDVNAVLNYERILHDSGKFSEITVRKVTVPLSGKSDDPALQKAGDTIRVGLNSMYHQISTKLADHGLTCDLAEQALLEVNDLRRNLSLDLYFVCARKHVSLTEINPKV